MPRFKLGVLADSFRLPLYEALARAKALGAEGVQLYAVKGEMAPENLGPDDRKKLVDHAARLGLAFSALCGDFWTPGFTRAALNPERIQRSKAIVDLARDLGAPAVTTHLGVVPDDPAHPVFEIMRSACRTLGDYAAERGVRFAIETGPETGRTLRQFLDAVDSPGMGVNLDPANLAMVLGEDPVEAVAALAPYLVHTHAKDGVNLRPCDPREVYGGYVGDPPVTPLGEGPAFKEVPLGEGDVDWPAYLGALTAAGFNGYLTVEREVGDDPDGDIARALDFLRPLIA